MAAAELAAANQQSLLSDHILSYHHTKKLNFHVNCFKRCSPNRHTDTDRHIAMILPDVTNPLVHDKPAFVEGK